MRSFRDLKIWQKGIELVEEVYKMTNSFPKDEQYGLSSQMRRSSISIPSNIAEGFRRRFSKEQNQFLSIVLGSCAELETQLVIARELSYINDVKEQGLLQIINHICGMTVNICKRIKDK
ncbi:MAG: four helix bundle protein [Candidatus Omnitrophota bacterium]|nr:MAG: four helix bundle protein [Candidatus Omnitrophota bacterium]